MKLRATHSGWAFLIWLLWWWTICLVLDGPASLGVYTLLLLITFPRWWVERENPKPFPYDYSVDGEPIDVQYKIGFFKRTVLRLAGKILAAEAKRKEAKYNEEEYD